MSAVLRMVASAANIIQNAANQVNTSDATVEGTVTTVIQVLLWIVGVLCVAIIVYGGIKYVTSAGDSSKTKSAQSTIVWAVAGLAVVILAYVIVSFVQSSISGGKKEPETGEEQKEDEGGGSEQVGSLV